MEKMNYYQHQYMGTSNDEMATGENNRSINIKTNDSLTDHYK